MLSDDQIDKEIDDAEENDDADEKILARATKLYQADKEHWDPIFKKAKDDLEFLSDEEGAQWPSKEFADRKKANKPTLEVDYLTQYVHQVANNIRMNTPSINPIPSGSKSSIEKSKIVKGLIRKIEYVSSADEVYDTAATSAVKCSIGFILIDHDYVDDDTFDQQLLIKRVINPFLIFIDRASIESDGRDMEHANVLQPMKVSKFKEDHPGKEPTSFGDDDEDGKEYGDEDEIILTQFYIKEYETVTMTAKNAKGADVKRTKKKCTVKRYLLSGSDVLEKTEFPGCYVPVVPVYGEEAWRDGNRHLLSLIRKAKGSQYMLNVMKSVENQILLKQPFAPVMVEAGSIENYKDDWADPEKAFALRYDGVTEEGIQLQAPSRLAPPQIPAGIVNSSNESVNDIRAATGMYQNSVGQPGAEISGRAIDARKIQGEVATYHFGDNTVRSITQCGRILVSAIPAIYDTERVIDIIDDEDKPDTVGINGDKVEGQEETHLLTEGTYDIRVITGQSFTTRRQASASFYEDIIKSNPDMIKVCGDLMFENMDIEGAQQMAARMRKLIDPKLLADDDADQDPEKMQLQQTVEQAKGIIGQMQQQMTDMQKQIDDKNQAIMIKAQNDAQKNQIAQEGNEIKKMQVQIDALQKLADANFKDRQLDITEQKNAGDLAIASGGQQFDMIMQMMERIESALAPAPELPVMGDTLANDGSVNNTGAI